MNKAVWSIFLFSILLSGLALSSESIQDTLEEGQTKTYTLGGQSLVVENVIVTDAGSIYTQFRIGGSVTSKLGVNAVYNLPGHMQLKILDINQNEAGDVTEDKVSFSITSLDYCGDNVCNNDESCSSCSLDCGCNQGYNCQSGTCVPDIKCGDGICHEGEDCEEDNCCSGIKVNLENDYYNCGKCSIICRGYEKCMDGQCSQVCGNDICESNEDCSSCSLDCGCNEGYNCKSGRCIENSKCGNKVCDNDENCGICQQDCKCDSDELCFVNICKSYCGNGICNSGETCSSCQEDCSCSEEEVCYETECIKPGCYTKNDCDDGDACTNDVCSGFPAECSNNVIEKRCTLKGKCVSFGTRTETSYCSPDNLMYSLESDGAECNNDYECLSSMCKNNKCSKAG